MNLLPVGWESAQLGDVCENLDSKRIPITKAKRTSGNIPYYGASGVVDYVAESIFDENLLLVSEDGANLLARTYPIAFSISGKSWVNNHAHVLRFKEMCSQRFIEYYLNSIALEPYVSGMAQPKLNQKSLKAIPVPFPILDEQKRIVAILDEAFAGITQAVTNAEKNLANSRELFESYLNSIFTQKGEGWVEKSLENMAQEDSPITYGVVKPGRPGNIRFVRGGDINRGAIAVSKLRTISRKISEQYSRTLLRGGELLVSLVGQPGQVAVVPKCLADANIARQTGLIRLRNEHFADYVCLFLRSSMGQLALGAQQSGSVQQVINLRDLKQVKVPLPSLKKQHEIVDIVSKVEKKTQHLEAIYQKKLTALTELKQSILQKAFTGELTADNVYQQVVNG